MAGWRVASVWISACLVLVGCAQPDRRGAVLVTIDTLRADHVGVYGAEDARTPRIDGLAREATLFERALSPLPLTRPSHFSMLTGRYPREHGVLNNSTALPEEAETLAELLGERGWRTAAFTATRILAVDSGAAQGFEHFESTGKRRMRSGTEVVRAALAWLDTIDSSEPFFLWVHLYEPHIPYEPPPGFRGDLDPAREKEFPSLNWVDFQRVARANEGDVPAPILEHARRLYRAEVAASDAMVGTLLDGLAARTKLDDVLVVLTADHGECFEKGFWFEHSDCLYEGSLRVPLIVRHPREFPPGARIRAPVSLLDVAPTVLRNAGLAAPAAVTGRPLQEAGSDDARHFLVQHPLYSKKTAEHRKRRSTPIRSVGGKPTRRIDGASRWMGVVGPSWKLLIQDGVEELYPMTPAPDESRNRAGAEPEVMAAMRRQLDHELTAHPLAPAAGGPVSPELREALEALGYVE